MSFRYRLEADGTTVGSFASVVCDWQRGDVFMDGGHRRWRILSVRSLDDPADLKAVGVFEVEAARTGEP